MRLQGRPAKLIVLASAVIAAGVAAAVFAPRQAVSPSAPAQHPRPDRVRARLIPASAPALTPDVWTVDAPAAPVRLAEPRIAPEPPASPRGETAPPAPPTQPQAPQPASAPAAAVQVALAGPAAKEERKICVTVPPTSMAMTIPAPPTLRLNTAPSFLRPSVDIAPPAPAAEQQRQIRLGQLLADALER
jgi:hypothetical protein